MPFFGSSVGAGGPGFQPRFLALESRDDQGELPMPYSIQAVAVFCMSPADANSPSGERPGGAVDWFS